MPLRDTPFFWLLNKELRELLVSRPFWVLLLLMGPLTGVTFLGAARTYAEVSGLNGTSAGVGEALSPLTGVWSPTFSACELAAVFLFPFVAIRIAGADRQSGALKLELQRRISPAARIGAKALAALAGWLVAMVPMALTILLWRTAGGSLYWPEIASVAAGHILNAGFTIALGFAAASLAEHPSTAAIVTLSVTVGTWIISFFAAVQGGPWERAATFTPSAVVAGFQHGLVRFDVLLIGIVAIAAGLCLASIWQRIGVSVTRRARESALLLILTVAAMAASSFAWASWDVSENRANSFPLADEIALRQLQQPLHIVVHLAPQDPRRADLEHRAFSKLRRIVPHLKIDYVSTTSIGLFEQTSQGYGEISYQIGNRTEISRAATEEGVLEAIYTAAAIAPTANIDEPVFRGHPLAATFPTAPALFYLVWPGLILLSGVLVRRKFQSG